MKKHEILKLIGAGLIGLVALVTSVAGAMYFLDEQYAPKDPTHYRLVGLELKSLLYQLERIRQQIVNLRIQHSQVPQKVQVIIDDEIERLSEEMKNIQLEIDLITGNKQRQGR